MGIGNFFGNLWDVLTAVNNLLQGKGSEGMSDIGRVLVNSTIGIGGIFDVASEMGMDKHAEDFGQTLGKWGVDAGPYFYWPIIGPRTTRDTFGWVVDSYMDPLWYFEGVPLRNSLVGLRFVDLRASLLPTDKIVDEAAFSISIPISKICHDLESFHESNLLFLNVQHFIILLTLKMIRVELSQHEYHVDMKQFSTVKKVDSINPDYILAKIFQQIKLVLNIDDNLFNNLIVGYQI